MSPTSPSVSPDPVVPIAPFYEDDLTTIYNADCLDVMPWLTGVDLIVTSPPYNLGRNPGGVFGHWKDGGIRGGNAKWTMGLANSGIDYDAAVDSMPPTQYQAWQQMVLSTAWETLSDTGAIFYNHKPRVQRETLWTPLVLNPGLPVRQIITWARAGGVNFNQTAYVPTSEWIIVFAKDKWRIKSRGASGVGDVWRIAQRPDPDHPAPFPIEVPAQAIETTDPSLALDPFMGVGTTMRAARQVGVRSIGIEVSERYCEIAVDRLLSDGDFGSSLPPEDGGS